VVLTAVAEVPEEAEEAEGLVSSEAIRTTLSWAEALRRAAVSKWGKRRATLAETLSRRDSEGDAERS